MLTKSIDFILLLENLILVSCPLIDGSINDYLFVLIHPLCEFIKAFLPFQIIPIKSFSFLIFRVSQLFSDIIYVEGESEFVATFEVIM